MPGICYPVPPPPPYQGSPLPDTVKNGRQALGAVGVHLKLERRFPQEMPPRAGTPPAGIPGSIREEGGVGTGRRDVYLGRKGSLPGIRTPTPIGG